MKNRLKKISFLYAINMRWKAALYKQRYSSLLAYYKKMAAQKGISYCEDDVRDHVALLLAKRNIYLKPVPKGKLKILYVGTIAGQDFGGIIQGLQKFGEVIFFECEPGRYGQHPAVVTKDTAENNGNRLVKMLQDARKKAPIDIVIGQMWASTMAPDALQKVREHGIPVVNIAMDDRHAFRGKWVNGNWSGTAGLIGSIDLACTAAKECCLWYQVEGFPSIYLPEASDPELYKPLPGPKRYDVCFVGANYGIRSKIVKAIEKRGVDVTCYGNGWPNGRIDVERIPKLFSRSRIILGVGTIGHCTDFYALKMRDFDGPMSGGLYVTHDNPDLYNLFEIGKEIVTYHTPEECADKISYYLNHSNECEIIAEAGRKRAVKEHTWERRFEKIFQVIGLI